MRPVRGGTQAFAVLCPQTVLVHLSPGGLRKVPVLLALKLRACVLGLQAPLGGFLGQHPSPVGTSVSLRCWSSWKLPWWEDTQHIPSLSQGLLLRVLVSFSLLWPGCE